jgi:hypothetical protein
MMTRYDPLTPSANQRIVMLCCGHAAQPDYFAALKGER